MTLAPELSRRLEAGLDAFLTSEAWDPIVRALARRLRALPLYADMGACILLRPSGELLEVGTDQDWSGEVSPSAPELDAEWRRRVLRAGVLKYPWLQDVLEAALGD
ncbi:MAG TPA: hypothetical protein VFN91_01290 [Myxococcaceae bacterium]|nr:hypothetical protein [Myxococcaceae bacterium]